MDEDKAKRLAKAGWKTGNVSELLDLTPANEVIVEVRLRLWKRLKRLCDARGKTVDLPGDATTDDLLAALAELGDGLDTIAKVIRSD